MERADLIAKLEAAEGPSRELDAEIFASLGTHILERRKADRKAWWYPRDGKDWQRIDPNGHYLNKRIPAYTSSLDAALTLVPEGATWMVSTEEPGPYAYVKGCGDSAVMAKTPALALVIAALRARGEG